MKPGIILFFLLFSVSQRSFSQGSKAIDNPGHQQQLDELKKLAADDMGKNLNRFALNKLQQYDRVLDTIFASEKRDTVAAIQQIAAINNRNLNTTAASLKVQIDNLKRTNLEQQVSSSKLAGRCSFFFLVLLLGLLTVLYVRKKLGQRYENFLNQNRSKIKVAEAQSANAKDLLNNAARNKVVLVAFFDHLSELNKLVDQLKELPAKGIGQPEWETISGKISQFSSVADEQLNLVKTLEEYQKNQDGEKTENDINLICSLYAGIVKKSSVNEKISTDFEKNKLPPVKMNTAVIGNLLLHVLTNAVQSVRKKASANIKGYSPQVSISTRLLPRFVQVRIHDNGDGIPDKELEQVYNQFYSIDHSGDSSGLGLYISRQIMEDHKGEIKIESDKHRGTDVYLKFFKS